MYYATDIVDCNAEGGNCKTQGEEEGLLTERGVSVTSRGQGTAGDLPTAGAQVIKGAGGLTGDTQKRPCLSW